MRLMNGLLHRQQRVFGNMVHVVGLCLCLYFFYHCAAGNRSVFQLWKFQSSTEALSLKVNVLVGDRQSLQEKVLALRPGSVDPDFLEEQSYKILGYQMDKDISLLNR